MKGKLSNELYRWAKMTANDLMLISNHNDQTLREYGFDSMKQLLGILGKEKDIKKQKEGTEA